jgi:hypothetical protein
MNAIEALRLARGYLAEAAGMLGDSDRDDAELLAQRCDQIEQEVRAVESAIAAKRSMAA